MGRAAFLAFRYNPQALQMVAPCGDLRHRGVRVVPQLLCCCQEHGRRLFKVKTTHLHIWPL